MTEDLIASLADNKYFLGRRYAEWCTSAPALEAAVAAAAMAQAEIGHARSLYPLLRDLVGESSEVEPETRTTFTNAPFLDRAFESWMDFVAANFLFDTAMSVLLQAARESTSGPLAQRARRILEEEQLHWLHAEGWTRRLAKDAGPMRDQLAGAFAPVLPQALAWFDLATPSLAGAHILDRDAKELRDAYRRRVNPILEQYQLPLA